MKLNKKTTFRIIIVIVDIIVLTLFIIMCFKWFKNRMNNEDIDDTKDVVFKKFTYHLPNYMEYSVVDSDRFILKTDDYEVVAMPYVAEEYDTAESLRNYNVDYGEYLLDHELNVSELNIIDVNDTPVYTYNKVSSVNSILCYYESFTPFYYELELFNSSGDYGTEPLVQIVDILNSADYDYNSTELYEYYTSSEVFHKFDIDY